jgi:CRP/FNR family cyclic AMP-dependent transcriptional regulator
VVRLLCAADDRGIYGRIDAGSQGHQGTTISPMNFRDVVPAAAWQDLLDRGHPRRFARGAVLLRQGESATAVIGLVEGVVKVLRTDVHGQSLTLMLRGPGEVLGEMGALLDRPRSATIVAVTPCSGRTLAATAFRGYLERHQLGPAVYELAVDRMERGESLQTELGCRQPIHRVACLISHLADEVGEQTAAGVVVELGMSRDELATATRMSRTSVVTALQELQRLDLLLAGRRKVVVKHLPRLQDFVTSAEISADTA